MKALSVVFLCFGALFSLASQTSAKARNNKISKNVFFYGLETPGEMIDIGVVRKEHDKSYIRGMIQEAQDVTNDDRVNGKLIIEINACSDPATHQGILWGTFVLENSGGKWFAGWIGRTETLRVTVYAMGYGTGRYQDLMANWTYIRRGEDQRIPLSIQGFIVKKG